MNYYHAHGADLPADGTSGRWRWRGAPFPAEDRLLEPPVASLGARLKHRTPTPGLGYLTPAEAVTRPRDRSITDVLGEYSDLTPCQ